MTIKPFWFVSYFGKQTKLVLSDFFLFFIRKLAFGLSHTFACVLQVTEVKNPKLYRMFKRTKDHFYTLLRKPTRFLFYGVPSEQTFHTICHVGWNTSDPGGMRVLVNCLFVFCRYPKARGTSAQNFALWQQATIEIT